MGGREGQGIAILTLTSVTCLFLSVISLVFWIIRRGERVGNYLISQKLLFHYLILEAKYVIKNLYWSFGKATAM